MIQLLKKEFNGKEYRRIASNYRLEFSGDNYLDDVEDCDCVTPWIGNSQMICSNCENELVGWHNAQCVCRCGVYWRLGWNYENLLNLDEITPSDILKEHDYSGTDIETRLVES